MRDFPAASQFTTANSRGDCGGQFDRVLLPVLLPGLPGMGDALSGLAERSQNAGQLLIEPSSKRGLGRLNRCLASFFGRFGFNFCRFLASLGDDPGRLATNAVEVRPAHVVEMERPERTL